MLLSDNVLISTALQQWANYIETGEVHLSRNDVINMQQHSKVRPLSIDQQKLVLRLRDLAQLVQQKGNDNWQT